MKCLICGTEFEVDDSNEPRICPGCWRCPKCGVDAVYDDSNGNKNQTGLIDEGEDLVRCYKCEHTWRYRNFEKAVLKKNNRILCPKCKGLGSIGGSGHAPKR